VAFPADQLPKRYRTDENGRRVLVGLSVEETFEFETLDEIRWEHGVPITPRQKRWLELYQKHEQAWRALVAEMVGRRPPKT